MGVGRERCLEDGKGKGPWGLEGKGTIRVEGGERGLEVRKGKVP
jgi:hypothetical protein